MSSFDVHPDEMHSDLAPDDDAIEATLAGRVPADRPDLAVLATFATEVRTAFEEGPAPRVSGALARLFDTGLATSAADAPGITTTGDRSGEGPARRRRRRRIVTTVLGTVVGKVAIAGVAAASVVGGMGAAGALPDPAQSVVSRLAGLAGIELPSGHQDERVPAKPSGEGTDHGGHPTSPSGSAGTGDDRSGTDDSPQGETVDDGDAHHRDDRVDDGDSEAGDTTVPAPTSGAGGPSGSDTSESDSSGSDSDASDPHPSSSGSSDSGSSGSGSSEDSGSSGSGSSADSGTSGSSADSGSSSVDPEASGSGSSDTGAAVPGASDTGPGSSG